MFSSLTSFSHLSTSSSTWTPCWTDPSTELILSGSQNRADVCGPSGKDDTFSGGGRKDGQGRWVEAGGRWAEAAGAGES